MRKLIVGLLAVGLLAVATPAMAQFADPLGLIASGAVLPYFGSGTGAIDPGSISFLEVYAPVGGTNFHMFFFDATCTKGGDSVGLPLTPNDVEIIPIAPPFVSAATPIDGLITAAEVDGSGFLLEPLVNPVHARVLWINVGANMFRTLEPIAIVHHELGASDPFLWNPLRSAATFFAPFVSGISTQLYLICPNDNITSTKSSAAFRAQPNGLFPPLLPTAQLGSTPTPLRLRVYDDEEGFLRDVPSTCNCLTRRDVTAISNIYASPLAPFGTYTEMEGGTVGSNSCSATAITPVTAGVSSSVCACADAACTSSLPCPGLPVGAAAGTVCPATAIPITVANFPNAGNQFTLLAAAHPDPFSFTGYRAITFGSGSTQSSLFSRLHNANKCTLPDDPTTCVNSTSR
jgi:hypothetical protein